MLVDLDQIILYQTHQIMIIGSDSVIQYMRWSRDCWVAWIQIVDCDCTLKYCSMFSLGRPPSVKDIVVLIKFSLFCNFLEDSHERIVFYCTIHRSVIFKNYQLYSLLRSLFHSSSKSVHMDGHIIVTWLYQWRNILGNERENSNVGLNPNCISYTTLSGTFQFCWGKDHTQGQCHCIFGASQPNGGNVFAVVLGVYW